MTVMHIHTLHPETHAALLDQARRDPISGDFLQEGDEVVFCASCRSAFLKDSWEYLGKKHCEQRRTLQEVPQIHEGVKLRKVKDVSAQELPPVRPKTDDVMTYIAARLGVQVVDTLLQGISILVIASILTNLTSGSTDDLLLFFETLLFMPVLYLFWDIFFVLRSPGKRIASLVVVKLDLTQKAAWWQLVLRRFCTLCIPAFAAILSGITNSGGWGMLFFLTLFGLNITIGPLFRYSLVSWITQTRVIEIDEHRWLVYQAESKSRIQL